MVILDVSVVNVALPSIRAGLGFSTTGLQWVVNAYTLTFAGLLMLGGRSADLLGRRRVFLVGTAMFALSSLAYALAASRGLLIGACAHPGRRGGGDLTGHPLDHHQHPPRGS
jgi:MFS family permease